MFADSVGVLIKGESYSSKGGRLKPQVLNPRKCGFSEIHVPG